MNDPLRWESECLQAFIDWHHSTGADEMRAWNRTLRGVRLEGDPPTTKLIVDFYDGDDRANLNLEFDLWGPDFEVGFEGQRNAPRDVVFLIKVSLLDPAFPVRDG